MKASWGACYPGALAVLTLLNCDVCRASATDFWITQNGAGIANGSSLANAASCGGSGQTTCAAFNNASNWGSAVTQIGPGTTIHVSGTFTAAANAANYFTFQGSGSSANPVILLMDSSTNITAPSYASGAFAIYSNGHSYITINGGANGSATAGTLAGGGIVQATANGTGLIYHTQGNGIGMYNGSNFLVENLTIANIYVHTCTLPVSNCTDENGDPTGAVYFSNASNVTVNNIVAHDMKWCLQLAYSNGNNNITLSNNMLYNVDHGVALGAGAAGAVISGVYIFGNYYHDPQNWDDNGNLNHHDGVHEWAPGTGTCINNTYIYNNYFYGDFGLHMNDAIYQENFTGCTGNYIFNNVAAPSAGVTGNAMIGVGANSSGGGGGWLIANNTIIGYSTANQTGPNANSTTGATYNNIISTINGAIGGYTGSGPAAIDYNDYYNIGGGGWNGGGSLSAWSSYCITNYSAYTACDQHSITGNPNLISFVPSAGSPVIGAGRNLYSVCSGQANPGLGALCYDAAGVPRPSGASWDIGAYQHASVGAPVAPPTLLSVTIQ